MKLFCNVLFRCPILLSGSNKTIVYFLRKRIYPELIGRKTVKLINFLRRKTEGEFDAHKSFWVVSFPISRTVDLYKFVWFNLRWIEVTFI